VFVIGEIRCRSCGKNIELVPFDFFAFRGGPTVHCDRCNRKTSLPFIASVLVRFAGMFVGFSAGRVAFHATENAFGRPIGLVPFVLVLFAAFVLWLATELSISALLYRRR
jgi:hypothetical protein